VLLERLTDREGIQIKKNPQIPANNPSTKGGATKTKSSAGREMAERKRGRKALTTRAISKASCRISSFMSALLSWILWAAAAGGGDPAPTGLRSSEEARTTACAAPAGPCLASSDILGGGWSGAAGHASPSRGML
jgi:hypothetical protein